MNLTCPANHHTSTTKDNEIKRCPHFVFGQPCNLPLTKGNR